jgi:hypothetical protein
MRILPPSSVCTAFLPIQTLACSVPRAHYLTTLGDVYKWRCSSFFNILHWPFTSQTPHRRNNSEVGRGTVVYSDSSVCVSRLPHACYVSSSFSYYKWLNRSIPLRFRLFSFINLKILLGFFGFQLMLYMSTFVQFLKRWNLRYIKQNFDTCFVWTWNVISYFWQKYKNYICSKIKCSSEYLNLKRTTQFSNWGYCTKRKQVVYTCHLEMLG